MQQEITRPRGNPVPLAGQPAWLQRSVLSAALCLLGLSAAPAAQAFEYGPFSLTGFAKVSVGRVSNGCAGCQRDPQAGRHFIWADDIVYGKEYGGLNTDSAATRHSGAGDAAPHIGHPGGRDGAQGHGQRQGD